MADDRLHITDGAVDTAVIADFERSRRDLLRRGLAVGGVVLAASTIPALLRVRTAFAQAEGDEAILEGAIGLEQTAVLAYGTAVESGLLKGRARAAAKAFRADEQEHLDALSSALRGLGARVPTGPVSAKDVEGLSALKSQRDVLEFAVELETMGVAAYYDAHRKLKDARLLQTGASIMANEGQHLVVLRQALKRDPVPNAFETGKASR